MNWAHPWMLLALLLLAAAAWRIRRARLGAKPLWPAMSRVSVGANGGVHVTRPRRANAAYLIIAAVAFGVVALARPQWGEHSEVSFSQGIEVMIALDLSRSMWTEDMPEQTARLRVAKATIEKILDSLRGENVGLVVFAGTAFVQVPMSPDYQIIREFLPSLDPNYMPVGGTAYDGMLASALEGFSRSEERDRYLIVLSDGESTKADLAPRTADLLRRSVHVIGIGFGTEQGAPIPDQQGGQMLDRNGSPVVSRLSPAALQDLATRTQGLYTNAAELSHVAQVRELIRDYVESGHAGRARNANVAVGVERFQWFLVPAVLLSLLSLAREFRRHPRPRAVRRLDAAGGAATVAALAALATTLCMLASPRVQAHHNEEAGFEVTEDFRGDPAQRVRAIASHMGKFGYDAYDLKLLVQAAMQFALSERSHGRLPLRGVMRDAVEAAHRGEELAPQLAEWEHYEAQIHELMAPLPGEAREQDEENEYVEEEEIDDHNYRPVPLRKARDKQGKDLFGDNTRARSEFAPGDLSGDETFAPQEPHGGRRVGRSPAQPPAPALGVTPADNPTMAEARKNFTIVVKADSPGRVHQLLNGEGKRVVEQDW